MKLSLILTVIIAVGAVFAVKPRANSRFQRLKSGPTFARQEAEQPEVPHTIYGPPPANPSQEYGPPTTTEQEPTTTEPEPTTTERPSGVAGNDTFKGKIGGVYYVYHPDGRLQKVLYSTKKDLKKMDYTTRVKYENVEPITAPIFTYDPQSLVLRRFRD